MAGYDLVFTPVKSASLLWALGSAGTRQAVEDAHHETVADMLAWLERETAHPLRPRTRSRRSTARRPRPAHLRRSRRHASSPRPRHRSRRAHRPPPLHRPRRIHRPHWHPRRPGRSPRLLPPPRPRPLRLHGRDARSRLRRVGTRHPSRTEQGRTVDTAHVLVDDTMTRESLYVAATRGRTGAHLYVQNEQLLGLDAERPPAPSLDPMDELVAVLTRETGERTATEVQREAQASATDERARRRREPTVSRARTMVPRVPSRRL